MELLRMLALFAGSVGLLRHDDDDFEDENDDKEDVDADGGVVRAAITTTESATTIKVEIAIPFIIMRHCATNLYENGSSEYITPVTDPK